MKHESYCKIEDKREYIAIIWKSQSDQARLSNHTYNIFLKLRNPLDLILQVSNWNNSEVRVMYNRRSKDTS